MTDDQAMIDRAGALKYGPAVCHFAEILPGTFALYDHQRQVLLITDDWAAILSAYRERPVYIPRPRRTTGIDLSTLEFTL